MCQKGASSYQVGENQAKLSRHTNGGSDTGLMSVSETRSCHGNKKEDVEITPV